MKQYNVLSPFKDADGIHKPGDKPVSMTDEAAAELIEIGAVEAVPGEAQPSIPVDGAERQAAIIEAINKMDKEDADLWLRDGKPDVSALADITGWPLTAAERNTAWAAVQASQG